jgi:hypothetical protein
MAIPRNTPPAEQDIQQQIIKASIKSHPNRWLFYCRKLRHIHDLQKAKHSPYSSFSPATLLAKPLPNLVLPTNKYSNLGFQTGYIKPPTTTDQRLQTIDQPKMNFDRKELTNEELVFMYRNLLMPRMIEEKMLVLLRQGKISKWFSGIGQEAISVGCTLALQHDEWIMPLHRNLGVFTSRQMPLHKLFMQWQGNKEGYSKGRERSFHFGSKAHHICGMISHLGPQLAIADGVALAYSCAKKIKCHLLSPATAAPAKAIFMKR